MHDVTAAVFPRTFDLPPELADDPHARQLVERFLGSREYRRELCLDLIAVARRARGGSWPSRRLAILMLEHQILALPADDVDEFGFLLTALGIVPAGHVHDGHVHDGVLEEGYSTTELRGFILELRQRLARLNRVHLAIAADRTSARAVADFVQASRSACKLTLARYLLTPDEVVERIVGELETSTGLQDARALNQPCVRRERDRCFERLPPFEAAIVSALCRRSTIYWVSDATRPDLNGLVEYPLGTVVAVIKPPGSDLEIEIKRVGMRGTLPLRVVFARNGEDVPQTHRLQGGSMGYYLQWEAASAAALARVYRLIQGVDPPISRTLSVSTIYGIPIQGREHHVVQYFRRLIGPAESDDTRRAMHDSIEAFRREMKMQTLPHGGDLGLATQFLGQVAPTQSILTATSSFRLDRVVAYLSADGADRYFEQIQGAPPSPAQAKAFVDELLEEVLGVVTASDTPFITHTHYVESVLSHPENRARAERQYRRLMREIGRFWGTLLGMRAYTYGESFVARNVGLKSVWEDGEWTTTIRFLDHDGTYLSGQRSRQFRPLSALAGMVGDEMHIWGFKEIVGSVALFRTLFRIDVVVEREAQTVLREELRTAFNRARRAISEDPEVQACFFPEFVERFRDWDEMVVGYLGLADDPAVRARWRERTSLWLEERGYAEKLRREHLRAFERHGEFLERYAFLY